MFFTWRTGLAHSTASGVPMVASFEIWFAVNGGEAVKAFTWTRDAASGIKRAKRDAAAFGYDVNQMQFWATAI